LFLHALYQPKLSQTSHLLDPNSRMASQQQSGAVSNGIGNM